MTKTNLEWESCLLFLNQVMMAGGLEPVDRQVTSVFLPAEMDSFLDKISTVRGLTVRTTGTETLKLSD